jgi:hypothetical protein
MSKDRDIILVLGDFMIDVTWILSEVPSPTSQHHGGIPAIRRLHPDWNDERPGGAGMTCMALSALRGAPAQYEVHGLGVWNPRDDKRWINLDVQVHNEFSVKHPKFWLHRLNVKDPDEVVTTVKRRYYYQWFTDTPRLAFRFDQDPTKKPTFLKPLLPKSVSILLPYVKVVVVMDFDKGCVQAGMLAELYARLQNSGAKPVWIVDSKSDSLYKILKEKRIDVLLVNRNEAEMLASRGHSGPRKSVLRILGTGQPSLELLEVMQRIQSNLRQADLAIVVKLDIEGAAMFLSGKSGDLIYARREPRLAFRGIGAGDVFAAELAFHCLSEKSKKPAGQSIMAACISASAWLSYSEQTYWTHGGDKREKCEVPSPVTWSENFKFDELKDNEAKFWRIEQCKFWALRTRLRSLFRYKELVRGPDPVINVARARGFLGEFISTDLELRSQISSFVEAIRSYIEKEQKTRPLNCLVVAGPGAGKSFLVHQLCKELAFAMVEINVGQMTSREELLDSLSLVQNIHPPSRPLLLLDEIDTKLENDYIYSLLLSPLWDRSLTIRGVRRDLPEGLVTILVASQAKSYSQFRGKTEKLPKGSDFLSRLQGPILELPNRRARTEAQKTSRVYIAADMILRGRKTARGCEKEVLDFFYSHSMDPRTMEQLIARLVPRNGIISLRDDNGKPLVLLKKIGIWRLSGDRGRLLRICDAAGQLE